MASKPLARADLVNQVESFLDDTSNAIWSASRLDLLLDDALTEVSNYSPYIMRDIYQIESRTGSASSTSSNNLVDATNSQFLSGDVGKVVYNTDDKTWAVITSYSSATQVGLSKDIFTSGEDYEIYNKACWSKKQINIENSDDWLWIVSVEYPVGHKRNWKLHDQNKVLELDVIRVDDTANTDANKDVYVYFARQHKVNPNTDLEGDTNAVVAVGATSMKVDGLTDADSYIYKDTLFTVEIDATVGETRQTYRVTADAAISSNAATISFFPSLECALSADDVVNFVGSTLTPEIERQVVQIVIGEAMMSEAVDRIDKVNIGGSAVSNKYYETGERTAEKARARLKANIDVDERANFIYSRA